MFLSILYLFISCVGHVTYVIGYNITATTVNVQLNIFRSLVLRICLSSATFKQNYRATATFAANIF